MKYLLTGILIAFITLESVSAQSSFKSADVIKIKFIVESNPVLGHRQTAFGNSMVMGLEDQVLEFVPGKSNWDCYRFKHIDSLMAFPRVPVDSTKTFFKHVSSDTITRFLSIISTTDTLVNLAGFNINKAELVKYQDSVAPVNIRTKQKAEFNTVLLTDTAITSAINENLKTGGFFAREPYDTVEVLLKNGKKILALLGRQSIGVYQLPWRINGLLNCNPEMSILFEDLLGDDANFIAEQQKKLYKEVAQNIYFKDFATRFNWANFKEEEPASYSILKGTLTPIFFGLQNNNYNISFRSSLLPSYVELRTYCKQGDSSGVLYVKKLEDTLISVFKNHNFLFHYLDTSKNARMMISHAGSLAINYLKNYSGLGKLVYEKSLFITVYGNNLDSHWLLLPDNSLILLQFYGNQIGNKIYFMNFDTAMFKAAPWPTIHHPGYRFDASGKLLSDQTPYFSQQFFNEIHY